MIVNYIAARPTRGRRMLMHMMHTWVVVQAHRYYAAVSDAAPGMI